MRILILADRLGRELLPLTDATGVALLPVAGKPLLEHTLDLVADIACREAVIACAAYTDQIRALVGDGRRWGLSLSFAPSRGEEAPHVVLNRFSTEPFTELLLIRGDMLRGGSLTRFLEGAEKIAGPVVYGVKNGRLAGVALLREGRIDAGLMGWPAVAEKPSLPLAAAVELGPDDAYPLDSLADFHRANLDAAAGDIPGLRLPGRETALGLRQGHHTRLSPRSLRLGCALVGSNCRVDPSAEFYGTVVLSDRVLVDRLARLANTVVLPNTYVGEMVDLREAIVRGNDLIRVDTGALVHVPEPFLLADLKSETLGHFFAAPVHRLAGVALLLLSLPLWPIAAFLAYRDHPSAPLRRLRLRSNKIVLGELGQPEHAEFTAFEWATEVPILRALPRLFGVIAGHLRIVGVEPVSAEHAARRIAAWERLADSAPAGLIGPTQIQLDAEAPEEERLMSDAVYAVQRSPALNLRLLLEACLYLLSPRAWRGKDRR